MKHILIPLGQKGFHLIDLPEGEMPEGEGTAVFNVDWVKGLIRFREGDCVLWKSSKGEKKGVIRSAYQDYHNLYDGWQVVDISDRYIVTGTDARDVIRFLHDWEIEDWMRDE